jgi:Raf kinase inhibitor-like YbhB/YbcL family protein
MARFAASTLLLLLTLNGGITMAFTLTSNFSHNGAIDSKHTCEGSDVSPPLSWSGAPEGTKSLTLIVDDPDAPDPKAPKMTWVHWVLYDIPADATSIPEGATKAQLPSGTKEGLNDWNRKGYGGPCPPIGRHRYFHKLYALDTVLPDLGAATKAGLEAAMKGHILGKAELVGTYQKKK